MSRLTIDENASSEHSQQRGVEYIVLRINDNNVIDENKIDEMGQQLYDHIDTYPHVNLCLDFRSVDFCSSVFLENY